MINVSQPNISGRDQDRLADTLGIEATATEEMSIDRMRSEVDATTDAEFASVGEAIREDLEGELDADLLASALSEMQTQIDRIPEVREVGIPGGESEPEVLYRELAESGWRVYDHLVDVGFFESVDENQPRFTADHITDTAHTLVGSGSLQSELEAAGLEERERLALLMDVTNNPRRLSRWVPTSDIPEGVEFDVEHVPPLHQRTMGGALLWTKNLDVHLWQKSILVTDEMLDDAAWDVKAMLGGMYLLTRAALEIADDERESFTDGELTAALTASAAVLIINQEAICQDAYRITEEMRAPSEYR